MRTELYDYDIYPKVVRAGAESSITIRPLGRHAALPDHVRLCVSPLQERVYPQDDAPRGVCFLDLTPDADGVLRFSYRFDGEQEYFLQFTDRLGRFRRLMLYSVLEDLAGLVPLMGDLHLHSIRSDGQQDPAIVAAHLRQQGYDYIALTDHGNFFGSLEAIDAYKDVPLEMCLMTGEEVHLPDCHLHCIHIGGRYSVNAMVDTVLASAAGKAPDVTNRHPEVWRQGAGSDFPGTMSEADFRRKIDDHARSLEPIPDGIPRYVYAGFCWICDQIRAAGGLSIFPHPYWIHDSAKDACAFHCDERLTEYLFQKKPFDAFEVLGGESYYEQNGFQTAHYYDALSRGMRFPVVGSSDSHSSVNNPNAFIAKTLCFAKDNDTASILEAIRAGRSVAVDAISAEYRLVGEYRLIKYARFLMEDYFPLHQAACNEQGRAMKEYHCGDRSEGEKMLRMLDGRIRAMRRKYFAF